MTARSRAVHLVCAAFAVSLLPFVMVAQDVTGPSLKAAYLHKFAQFTDWPADVLPAGAPITMCVVGDTAVRDALERTVKNMAVAGHAVVVSFGTPDKLPQPCHLLYVSAVPSAQTARLLAGLREVPVLTISDHEGFNELNGIVELFYENGALRFYIRLDAIPRTRLQVSSKLLQLARPRR